MQTVDLSTLLDRPNIEEMFAPRGVPTAGIYHSGDGAQFRSNDGRGDLLQEVVRLSDRAFLLASDCAPANEDTHRQVVADTDWLHIQLRLNGGGHEDIASTRSMTPERSCVIARYPKGSVIERKMEMSDRWKFVCLLVSPRGLADLFDVPASRLGEWGLWMAHEDGQELQTRQLPLDSSMIMAANDILSCQFKGATRRAYMRAKSLELFSTAFHTLGSVAPPDETRIKLSARDIESIARARALMTEELESTLTLAELARRVGLNRTKLALGFKQVYGISVQAYWRDAKLCHARQILRNDGSRVTEVALSLGYSELSSFTRAFSRKFGVLPRDCKRGLS